MSKSANRLGKGLNALISAKTTAPHPPAAKTEPAAEGDVLKVRQLPVADVLPNPHQPRTNFPETAIQELAGSIRERGVIQPIVVRQADDGRYQIVAGERRWRAAQLAKLTEIPAIIRDVTDAESFELALIENLQREDLGPLERAQAYQHYLDTFGGTIEDLARKLSESRANVSNYIRILRLPDEVRDLIANNELGMGQARALVTLSDPHRQVALARLAVRRNLSVRQVEALIQEDDAARPTTPPPASQTTRSRHLDDVEQAFSRALGLRVRLFPGKAKNSGRLVIRYANLEEFDRIADKLGDGLHVE